MTVIIQSVPCSMIANAEEPVKGTMVLGWIADYPPLVKIDFHHPDTPEDPSRWEIGRDVLLDCMMSDASQYNQPFGGEEFSIERGQASGCIKLSTTHKAAIVFPLVPVIEFLVETIKHVPRGSEQENEIMATWLDLWLEENFSE